MKILLADDHALFRDGFNLLLQQQEPGVQCLVAGGFDEAMALLALHPEVELLMLDYNMPGMRGGESVAAVQRDWPGMPVCILSGEESPELMGSLLAVGASGFIPKSSSPQVMMSALRLMLAGGVYVPPQMVVSPATQKPAPSSSGRGAGLTERQMDILRLLAEGKPNKLICRELNLSEGTVKTHINALYRCLGVENRTEAAVKARHMGLVK